MQFEDIVTQKIVSMMTYFGKNGILQANCNELWHVVSITNKAPFIATKWTHIQKNPSSNCKAMSNPIWSNLKIVFWVWYLIIGSYQLLNCLSDFCIHDNSSNNYETHFPLFFFILKNPMAWLLLSLAAVKLLSLG